MTEAAVLARCRRMCEVKSRGNLNVPEWLHQKWKSDNKGLAKLLHDSGFDKALSFKTYTARSYIRLRCFYAGIQLIAQCLKDNFIATVEKIHIQKNSNKLTVEEGWFTEADMSIILKWSERPGSHEYIFLLMLPARGLGPPRPTLPRKKIKGAIKICEQDPDNLIQSMGLELQSNFGIYIFLCSIALVRASTRLRGCYRTIGRWQISLIIPVLRACPYSGEKEYWVRTRVTGKREAEESVEEVRKQVEVLNPEAHAYMQSEITASLNDHSVPSFHFHLCVGVLPCIGEVKKPASVST